MARIRTIKPEFFRHESLQELGAIPMLVFNGLLCAADREGRFHWRPKLIKLDVLPFIDFDMAEVMERLAGSSFIQRYQVSGETYGLISNWSRHQMPSRDEPPSEIPSPTGAMTAYDRPPNQTQRLKIYSRDNYCCLYCRRDLRNDSRAICLDHVIPYVQGGTNRERNLATACKKCNAAKGCRTPSEAGLSWPEGLGEQYETGGIGKKTKPRPPVNGGVNGGVNGAVTDGSHPPDMDRELGRGRELEREREPAAPRFTSPSRKGEIQYRPEVERVYAFWRRHFKASARKADALKWIERRGKEHGYERLIMAVNAYRLECDHKKTEEKFWKECANFFGEDAAFEGFLPSEEIYAKHLAKAQAELNGGERVQEAA